MPTLNEVLAKINSLEKGDKTFFQADKNDFESFQNIYSHLEQLQVNGKIRINPHHESKTGNRWIDLVSVEKL